MMLGHAAYGIPEMLEKLRLDPVRIEVSHAGREPLPGQG
jgi:hypothetical protein